MLSTALLFLSSAMVPVEMLAPGYQLVFRLNPLTFIIDEARKIALWGQLPDWQGLGLYTLGALLFCYLSYAWFRATRPGIADVL